MILWLLALGWNDLNVESHFAFCYLLPPAATWAWVWIPQAEVDRVREEGPIEAGNGGNGDGKDSKDGKGKDGKDSKAKKNAGSGSGSKVTHGYDYDYDCERCSSDDWGGLEMGGAGACAQEAEGEDGVGVQKPCGVQRQPCVG